MRKKVRLITFLTAAILILLFSQSLAFADSFSDSEQLLPRIGTVSPNKVWTIKFNSEIKKETVNTSNIKVYDSNQQPVGINVTCGADNKSTIISPVKPYEIGKSYNLFINKNVQTTSGKSLLKAEQIPFTIDNPTTTEVKVCIDAGHGGDDFGQVGSAGGKESETDLAVALKIGALLQKNGVQVIYTRTTNLNIDLKSRFAFANDNNADYFISIHDNSYSNNTVSGIETYYLDGNAVEQKLAQNIQSELGKLTGINNRGAKSGQPDEVKSTKAPGVKLYLGFMTSPSDEKLLTSDDFQNKSALAVANGILNFIKGTGAGVTPQITSIQDINANVKQGTKYSLPSKVTAEMSDNSIKDVDVTWNNTVADTSKLGTYSFEGTVTGYTKKVLLALNVRSATTTIMLDAGHGGYDTGAIGPAGSREKDVTLAVTLKVGKILESRGIQVLYTRKSDSVTWPSDEGLDLKARTDMAKQSNADLFVSIHNNSFSAPTAYGTETYYTDGNAESQKLANLIQSEMISSTGLFDRGIRTANYYVLKYNTCPAVLAELAFISNPDEEKLLNDSASQDKWANAISNGIMKYLSK